LLLQSGPSDLAAECDLALGRIDAELDRSSRETACESGYYDEVDAEPKRLKKIHETGPIAHTAAVS
jgi:hypothetical protein